MIHDDEPREPSGCVTAPLGCLVGFVGVWVIVWVVAVVIGWFS